jgi:hypothetical protein
MNKTPRVSTGGSLAGRLWILASCALLLASNLFLFSPLNIYLGNVDEFEIGYLDIAHCYWTPFFLVFFALLLAGFLFKGRGWKRYGSFLFGLGVLTWIQGNFLMWNYGVLDARGIDWKALDRFAWLDSFIWIAILLVTLIGSKRIIQAAALTCWTLVAVQAISLIWQVHVLPGDSLTKPVRNDNQPPSEIFQYSAHRNILHVVLDSLQTDIFWELAREKALREDWDGFVLFRDNATAAPVTSFAIPAMFSGSAYDGTISEHDYYRNAMEHGFQDRLYEEGYTVNLIPEMSMKLSRYSNYYSIPSVYNGRRTSLIQRDAALLFDVSLFRQVPHFFIRLVYNKNNWFITAWIAEPENILSIQQKIFFRDYIERLNVSIDPPAYHFLHLWPPHPPYVTDGDGHYAGAVLPNTRNNYKNEARSILLLFGDLLDKLRRMGIYDQTMIILQGDHGSGVHPMMDGKSLDFMPTRLAALLAIKRRGAHGPMMISNAQTSVTDVARSIMEAEGISSSFPGNSVFGIDPDRNRERFFVGYTQEAGGTRNLVRYSINGSIYEEASYKQEASLKPKIDRKAYHLGELVKFGLNGNGGSFLRKGWAAPMDSYSWSCDRISTIEIPLKSPSKNLSLSVSLIPNVYPQVLPRQRIGVVANGKKVAEWIADSKVTMRFSALIPHALAKSEPLTITFELPDAASPRQLGFGADVRKLAIAIFTLKLDSAEAKIPASNK